MDAPIVVRQYLPILVTAAPGNTRRVFLEFFSAHIRNHHTRKAYLRAVVHFLDWCDAEGVSSLEAVGPLHVAGWVRSLEGEYSLATTKQCLAAVRMLFDWLALSGVVPTNPAKYVKGPRYSVRRGTTPVVDPDEVKRLFASLGNSTISDLRDRALIGLMTFTFARIGAALTMNVGDIVTKNRRLWVRLLEKGGKLHEMPCHHLLEHFLLAYTERAKLVAADEPLFRSLDRVTGGLTSRRLLHANAYDMIKRRCRNAGLSANVCCHSFRATGITTYLLNGGTIERAALMANHTSIRTTQLYDHRDDETTLDEVERIAF